MMCTSDGCACIAKTLPVRQRARWQPCGKLQRGRLSTTRHGAWVTDAAWWPAHLGYPPTSGTPRPPGVRKCEMCSRRPERPACAEACPTGTTITGERSALLAEARRRILEDPKTYFPYIYGEREAGSTSVLRIGPSDPASLGLPSAVPDQPLPYLTWRALRHVLDVVLFGGVLLSGFWWLTKRKEEVARKETLLQKEEENDE